jgi:uncharacterized membrane protein
MVSPPPSPLRRTFNRLWSTFLTGLIAVLPIAATSYLVIWLVSAADALFGGMAKPLLPDAWDIPGIGIALAVLFVFGVGTLLKTGLLGPLLMRLTEAMFERLPLINSVYRGARDVMGFLSHPKDNDKRHVALITLANDVRLIGFITDASVPPSVDSQLPEDGEKLMTVYLPMSYQVGGYTLYLPERCVQRLDISIEEAMRMVLTAGMHRNTEPATTKTQASAS